MPQPGEEVVGYITRGKGIAIHRECCNNIQDALTNEADRIQRVDWAHSGDEKYAVPLRIETMDRVGVMADVSAKFSERKINIEKANIRTLATGGAVWEMIVDVSDTQELEYIVRVVSSIPDVLSVTRGNTETIQSDKH
jgi:(p)ppGpp synthase/HD superfamily hydrolase